MKGKKLLNNSLLKSGIALLCAASVCVSCFPVAVSAETERPFECGAANGDENETPIPTGGGTTVDPHDSSTFTILEVLPDKKCGLMGFWFGGCEPLYVREEAFSYKSESEMPTIQERRAYAMDAFVNDITGGDSSTNHDPFFHNSFTITSSFGCGEQTGFVAEYGLSNGYFERVKKGYGMYGYSDKSLKVTEGKVKTVPGTGEYKITRTYGGYRCVSDIKTWERGNYLDDPLFDVTFKAATAGKSGVDYFAPETITKVKKGKGEYKQLSDGTFQYVGLDKDGEYNVTFEAQYNKGYDKYSKRIYYVEEALETGNGTYLASKNDSKEDIRKRSSTSTIEEGFDYTDGITDINMTSKFQKLRSGSGTDNISWDYIWVEDNSSDLPVSTTAEVGKKLNKMKEGDRVYLKNYYKAKYLNNELFWSMIYQDDNGKYGIPGTSGDQPLYLDKDANGKPENLRQGKKYELAPDKSGNGTNKEIVEAWKAGKNIQVIPCSTDSINPDDLAIADLICFDSASDGAYIQQMPIYNCCFDTTGTSLPGSANQIPDITWQDAVTIFKRVVVDGNCAICFASNFVNHYDDSNIKKLYYMLYGVQNKETTDLGSDFSPTGKGNPKLGSGRDFFLDFIEDLVVQHGDPNSPNLETLASDNYLKYSYLDENGNVGWNGGTVLQYQHGNVKQDLSWNSKSPVSSWVKSDGGSPIFEEKFLLKSGNSLQLPVYYYYKEDPYKYFDDDFWRNPANETYWNNQMIYNSTHSLFNYMRDNHTTANATWIGKILRYNGSPFMSLKIKNYDSCNSSGTNKLIPINFYEYEKMKAPSTLKIPINYLIQSSTEIDTITITKADGSTESPHPELTSSDGYYKYDMTYWVDADMLTLEQGGPRSSNLFTVTARNVNGKELSDSVYISIRGMFDLN